MTKIKTEKDICPRCGKEFHCSKSKRCWCYEIELRNSIMEHLQDQYESCLCPDCLREFSSK